MKINNTNSKDAKYVRKNISEDLVKFGPDDLYSLDKNKYTKIKNDRKSVGNMHLSIAPIILFVIMHIVSIFISIIAKEYGAIILLIVGLVVLILLRKIKIDYDYNLHERINHHKVTTKAILNYFEFFGTMKNKTKLINYLFLITVTFTPFIIIWNTFTNLFVLPLLIVIGLWFVTLIIHYYDGEFFDLEKKLSFSLYLIMFNIFLLGLGGHAMYFFMVLLYGLNLILFKFFKIKNDREREGMNF